MNHPHQQQQQHPRYSAFPPQQQQHVFFQPSYPPPAPPQQHQQQQQQPAPQQQPLSSQPGSFYSTPGSSAPLAQHRQPQQPPPQSHFFQSLPQGAPNRPSPHSQQLQRQRSQQHVQQHAQQLQHQQPSQQQQQQQQHRQQTQRQQSSFVQPDLIQSQPSLPASPDHGRGEHEPESRSPSGQQMHGNLMNTYVPEPGHSNQGSHAVDEGQDNDDDDDDGDEDDLDDDGNPDDPVYYLAPPPEAIYPNEIELEKALHAWSLEHGYELVRRASKKNARGQLYKRYFHCSKHGRVSSRKKTPEKNKVRVNRKSNRIGCPMSLAVVSVNPSDPSGDWQIRHRKTHHNHPAVDAIQLAGHRRRARVGGVEKAVDGLFQINTSTSDVLKFLQTTNPDGLYTRTDVANMKLKYKAFGTCALKKDATGLRHARDFKPGIPTACNNCRAKKRKCDSVRPACGSCVKIKLQCTYDHNPQSKARQNHRSSTMPSASVLQQDMRSGMPEQLPDESIHASQAGLQSNEEPSMIDLDSTTNAPDFVSLAHAHHVGNQGMNSQNAMDALAALTNFQQEHVRPTKLSLDSSQVESLASSTCGNGDCYKSVSPRPFTLGGDWRSFKESFHAAAVRENTNDVLNGHKKEPEEPSGEVSIDRHNEYIKQLAIFKRRNEMLKIGIKECLHPSLWTRVRGMPYAADMWSTLEDVCQPRGSDAAYLRFLELQAITLQTSYNLDSYILQLETKWHEYNQIHPQPEVYRRLGRPPLNFNERYKRVGDTSSAGPTFPEEMLCFLFLQNLGPQHQNLAKGLTRKANIGGYGTGERVGFKQLAGLVKRHFEWDVSRSRGPQ